MWDSADPGTGKGYPPEDNLFVQHPSSPSCIRDFNHLFSEKASLTSPFQQEEENRAKYTESGLS
jgi:hypothetical protein